MDNYGFMTVDQLKEKADKLGIKYTSKVRKADLIREIQAIEFPSLDITHQYIEPKHTPKPKRRSGKPLKGLVNGKPMPMHYKGRAMGAKHYAFLRAVRSVNNG